MNTEITEPDEYFLIGQDDARLAIYLRYPLFRALEDFAKRESQVEQAGLLVGRVSSSEGQKFLLVEDAIEAPVGDEFSGRFDENSWKRSRRIASARHPNRVVVGWFHTHSDSDLTLSPEERAFHKRHFPEDDHLMYVISSQAQDRNFYFRENGELVAAQGFRIYGKIPANSMEGEVAPVAGARAAINAVGPSTEQMNRHLERNIEKIQKRLQNPPLAVKDVAIIALLVVNALLIWFRPNPPVQVDNSGLERGQAGLSDQIAGIENRIGKLEKGLADVSLLDQQLKLAAGMEDIDGLPDEPETTTPVAATPKSPEISEPVAKGLAGGGGAIKLYKVKSGDILGVLVDTFYPAAPEGTFNSFARFNKLKGPDFSIFPGDTLKVPAVEALR